MPVDEKPTTVYSPEHGWIKAHVSHFITCPHAAEFRRPGS